MKYLITESQFDLIRRYDIINNLIDEGAEYIIAEEDYCDYTFSDFLEEIKWQVSDNGDEFKLGDLQYLHDLIEKNFYDKIKKIWDSIESLCNDYDDDDDDLDYYSGRLYGVDNNQ